MLTTCTYRFINLAPVQRKNVKNISILTNFHIIHNLFRFCFLQIQIDILMGYNRFIIISGFYDPFNFAIFFDSLTQTGTTCIANLLQLYNERCKKGWCLFILNNIHYFISTSNSVLIHHSNRLFLLCFCYFIN